MHRLVRAGVLLSAGAGIVLLVLMASGISRIDVDQGIPAMVGIGFIGGAMSSVRFFTVRLPVGDDATSIAVASTTWGQLRGLFGDIGFSALLGTAGWIIASIVGAVASGPAQSTWGNVLAFFAIGALWSAGWLLVTIAVFLVWMPAAIFVATFSARRHGRIVEGSWPVLAWCLIGLDAFILLMVATAVFVPTGPAHEEWAPWQTALFVVNSSVLVLISFAVAGELVSRLLPRKWRRRRVSSAQRADHHR
ncbi:hypothetical protein [Agromyces salentinus]|uniref:Uncharacterized protein n=1 Tax=Agromyces salentinus TaxID=269421 RepID=A0ABN2MEM8_9MICO|nr:hypothetical protein [Agromyces salentinus]